MSNQEQPHEAVDFELRRVARRRIVEVLDGHQKSEAETVEQTVKSILEFYRISLKALGTWVADSYESKYIPAALSCRPAFVTWKATAERRRHANRRLDDAESEFKQAVAEVNRIEPGLVKQMFCDKPGMREAKARRAETESVFNLAQFDLNLINGQFQDETKDLLTDLASSVEELPNGQSYSSEIEMGINEHIGRAKKLWHLHREGELAGLREVVDLTYVLAKVPGESNA